MTARLVDLQWVDDRLRAWARYFKDRHRYESCKSLESRYRATAEEYELNGWGDPSPPTNTPPLDLPSVLQTHSVLQGLTTPQRWAITYAFCYPALSRWQVLKLMKKWTGRRFTWRGYEEEVSLGRLRVAAGLLGLAKNS